MQVSGPCVLLATTVRNMIVAPPFEGDQLKKRMGLSLVARDTLRDDRMKPSNAEKINSALATKYCEPMCGSV